MFFLQICANFNDDPHIFSGDYFYQTARREKVDPEVLRDYVMWILAKWLEKHNGAMPKHVIILRDGLSEGQFPMANHFSNPSPVIL